MENLEKKRQHAIDVANKLEKAASGTLSPAGDSCRPAPNRQDKPLGWPAGCFWALGSGLGLVGTVSARR